MIGHIKRTRHSSATRRQTSAEVIPSPARVQAMAAEIRKGWSPAERRHRAFLARHVALGQFIADLL